MILFTDDRRSISRWPPNPSLSSVEERSKLGRLPRLVVEDGEAFLYGSCDVGYF